MTVTTLPSEVFYDGDGASLEFAVPFRFLADGDLRVALVAADGTETVQSLGSGYTVTGAGNAGGGTVTFGTAPADGQTVYIKRVTSFQQETVYEDGKSFRAAQFETDLDRHAMRDQEIRDVQVRTVRQKDREAMLDMTLPFLDARASRVMGFDASGQPAAGALIANIDAAIAAFLGGVSIGEISSVGAVATMEALTGMADKQVIYVVGYQANSRVGGGYFQFVAGSAVTVDNGLVFTAVGGRWFRILPPGGAVTVEMFGATGAGDDTSAIQGAMNAGVTDTTHVVILRGIDYAVSQLVWPTTYRLILAGQGRGLDGTVLNFTQTDGSDCLDIQDWGADQYRPEIRSLTVVGSANTGHGLHIKRATNGAGPILCDIEVRGCNGSGKAGIYGEKNFIAELHNVNIFNNAIGIQGINIKGWIGRNLWIADNDQNFDLDTNCSGNEFHCTELGLSSINTSKKAIKDAGHDNRYILSFYENFTAAQSIWFTSTAYNNLIEVASASSIFVFDEGRNNRYPVNGSASQFNSSALIRPHGPYFGVGSGTNLYYNSSFQGASLGWSDFSTSPPTRTLETAAGYFDVRSMKLDWGTSALSGVEDTTRTFAVTAGDELWCMHFMKVDRDMATREVFTFKILGPANENRWVHYVTGLKAGVWTPVLMRYQVTVAENVNLAIGMLLDSGTAHDAIITYHDDFVVMLNPTALFPLINANTATSRTLANCDFYTPRLSAENFGLGLEPIARRSHVADPSGGGTIDSEARAAISAILDTLEAFGFHATS